MWDRQRLEWCSHKPRMSAVTRIGSGLRGFFPRDFRGSMFLLTLWSQTSSFRIKRINFFCFKLPSFLSFIMTPTRDSTGCIFGYPNNYLLSAPYLPSTMIGACFCCLVAKIPCSNEGAQISIPGQGIISPMLQLTVCMPQLTIPHAGMKIKDPMCCS